MSPYGATAPGLCATPVGRFAMSHPLEDEGPGLDHQYPFHLNKILAARIKINDRD
jgi:hypothetical protein